MSPILHWHSSCHSLFLGEEVKPLHRLGSSVGMPGAEYKECVADEQFRQGVMASCVKDC